MSNLDDALMDYLISDLSRNEIQDYLFGTDAGKRRFSDKQIAEIADVAPRTAGLWRQGHLGYGAQQNRKPSAKNLSKLAEELLDDKKFLRDRIKRKAVAKKIHLGGKIQYSSEVRKRLINISVNGSQMGELLTSALDETGDTWDQLADIYAAPGLVENDDTTVSIT